MTLNFEGTLQLVRPQKVFLKYRLYRNSEYNAEYSESDESHVLTSENMKW